MRTHRWSGVEIDDLPHLQRWLDTIGNRPAAQKGVTLPPSDIDLGAPDDNAGKKFAQDARKMVEMGKPL